MQIVKNNNENSGFLNSIFAQINENYADILKTFTPPNIDSIKKGTKPGTVSSSDLSNILSAFLIPAAQLSKKNGIPFQKLSGVVDQDGDVSIKNAEKIIKQINELKGIDKSEKSKFAPIHDISHELDNQRFVIIGDIHGCIDELKQLLSEMHFNPSEDHLISVGDLMDRGPDSKAVLEFCMNLPHFHSTLGNHEEKLLRHLAGSPVKIEHGLQKTLDQFKDESGHGFSPKHIDFLKSFKSILKTPAGYVTHAGFNPKYPVDRQEKRDTLYMRYHGGKDYFDDQNGKYWTESWPSDAPTVFFGHEANPKGILKPNTISLDGGCYGGGHLKAWDSNDGQVHSVKAKQKYSD